LAIWFCLILVQASGNWVDQLAASAIAKPDRTLLEVFRKLKPDGPKTEDENELNNLGYGLLNKGKTEASISVFQLNTELFPHKANPWDSLAEAYLIAGQPEKAVLYYELAFEKDPDRGIWERLGRAYEVLGDPDREVAYARRTTARFGDADALDLSLAIRAKHGRLSNPLKAFEETAQKAPGRLLWRARQAYTGAGLALPEVSDGWQLSDYTAKNLNPHHFRKVLAGVKSGTFQKLDGLVVVHGDAIIGDAYFGDFSRYRPHDTRSAGKSITALLAGIAVDKGKLKTSDRLYDIFPKYRAEEDWEAKKDRVTVHHLLAMSSGLDAFDDGRRSPGSENFYQETQTQWADHVLRVPMAFEPGAQIVYASANYLLLGDLVAETMDQPLDEFAAEVLFEPLGISELEWFRAPNGKAYGAGGIRLTPRDLAKIGKLVLDQGMWRGKRLVSKAWIADMTSPKVEGILWGKRYGYGWYTHRVKVGDREIEVLSAAGNGGQRIWVMPDLNAVAVITMGHYNSRKQSQADRILTDHILPSLIAPE